MDGDRTNGRIDTAAIKRLMEAKAITSFSELCRLANIHRNSLQPYLKGESSVYSSVFERICKTLDTNPAELILDGKTFDHHGLFALLRDLWSQKEFSRRCCFLFGSRATGDSKKFSDYDIGLSAGLDDTNLTDFFLIKEEILIAVDNLPVSIDIVDFDAAPPWFISEVRNNFHFICGRDLAYQQFLGRVNGIRKALAAG